MSSSVEIFRTELEKWRHMFELDDVWTFEVVEVSEPSDKISVSVNYRTCSSEYKMGKDCPLDETDLNILALRKAVSMCVSHILLEAMEDDDEDADAQFHRAIIRVSDALTRVLGLSVLSGYENLKQTVKEVVDGKQDVTQGLISERAGHA